MDAETLNHLQVEQNFKYLFNKTLNNCLAYIEELKLFQTKSRKYKVSRTNKKLTFLADMSVKGGGGQNPCTLRTASFCRQKIKIARNVLKRKNMQTFSEFFARVSADVNIFTLFFEILIFLL